MLQISNKTLWPQSSFFHPKACAYPGNFQSYLLTLQNISGSDYYDEVKYTTLNKNWTNGKNPIQLPGFERKRLGNDLYEGICDVVPELHKPTDSVIAMGVNVYYRGGKLYEPYTEFFNGDKSCLRRYPVYAVMNSKHQWIAQRKRLEYPEFEDCSIYTSNCSQRQVLPNGKIIIPVTFGYFGRHDRLATTLLCDFDGREIFVIKRGSILELPINRGLLEPSIVLYQNRFFLTLRAEDGHGYLSASEDGLNWNPIKAWSWEDGTGLTMSTTQQHWLRLGGKLYLVYTRQNGENHNVTRWRAPLLIAEFNTEKLCLKKTTEQIVFPMRPHPENPESIGMMGNFHPLELSETEAIITVGEGHPKMNYRGDTLLAHLKYCPTALTKKTHIKNTCAAES